MMSNNKKPTQCEKVYNYMYEFGSITQMDALMDLGVMRLASRISEMRDMGIGIVKSMKTVHNRYGEPVSIAVYELARSEYDNKRMFKR